jgi:hypothetical protein
MVSRLAAILLVTISFAAVSTSVVGGARIASRPDNPSFRMPIGFFDDPSFRWSKDVNGNLAAAAAAHATIVYTLANWAKIAPTQPRNPLNGHDRAYHLADLDALVRQAGRYDLQVMITISGTPPWANGGQTPNHAPLNMAWLTQFSQMLAHRYNGANGKGAVTLYSVWNEPNLGLFLVPQFNHGRIVSPALYARLYRAAYQGIKKGNPGAVVAAGETSNRGTNRPTGQPGYDSVAPATFARMVAEVAPRLPFAAWAVHPYSPVFRIGPAQKVRFPNVSLSTLDRLGVALQRWFRRPIPIWITEFGEETFPEFHLGVSLANQAHDVRMAMKIAGTNPYVRMFVWFVFRDSNSTTWFSGLLHRTGKAKPAYHAYARGAVGIVGQTLLVPPFRRFSVTMPVPWLAYHLPVGTRLEVTYTIGRNGNVKGRGRAPAILQRNAYITFPVAFGADRRSRYTLSAVVRDPRKGLFERHLVLLIS